MAAYYDELTQQEQDIIRLCDELDALRSRLERTKVYALRFGLLCFVAGAVMAFL